MAPSQQTFDCGEPLAVDVDEKILLHGPLGIMQTPSSAKGSTTEPASMLCMVRGCISHVRLARAISTHARSTSGAAAAGVRERWFLLEWHWVMLTQRLKPEWPQEGRPSEVSHLAPTIQLLSSLDGYKDITISTNSIKSLWSLIGSRLIPATWCNTPFERQVLDTFQLEG